MTMRTANVKLRPTDTLDISAADAERLSIKDGHQVRVSSRYGTVKMKARIAGVVSSGELFATFHDTRVDLNNITGPFRDNLVQSPEDKVTAVCAEPLDH